MDQGQTTLWFESVIDILFTGANLIIQNLFLLLEVIPGYCESFVDTVFISADIIINQFDSSFSSLFTDFQLRLLEVFLGILFIHLTAIYFAWKKYSHRITERFLKISLDQVLLNEDFRTALSELKLPAEHTPRW